jgi:hypothetical protein
MIALRRHNVNGALEAIEDVHFAVASNFDGLVVVVSAMFAFSHKDFTPVNVSEAHSKFICIDYGSLNSPACSQSPCKSAELAAAYRACAACHGFGFVRNTAATAFDVL